MLASRLRLLRLVTLSAVLMAGPLSAGAQVDEVPPAEAARATDFSGAWDSTYGLLELTQEGERVTGRYSYAGGSFIEGRVEGARLTFEYREPAASGEGWFELAEAGDAINGMWHETGSSQWYPWAGRRSARAAAIADSTGFSGLFETTYGRLRLVRDGDTVRGHYSYGGGSTVEGTVDGNRLTFRYQEPTASGEGWFELSDDDTTFNGSWHEDDSSEWASWTGERVEAEPGRVWLVVLEAPWETSLAENEYSFGDMLRAYFERMPQVQVRHRRLYDLADFQRATSELAYLAEPVALLIASHGRSGELILQGELLGPEQVANAMARAPNVFLLHFSSCETMTNGMPEAIQSALPESRQLAISGYATAVDWSASALIEFLYLDLVLGRGFSPRAAADEVLEELDFAGDSGNPSSPLGPARFRFVE